MTGFSDWSIQDHDGSLSVDDGRVRWHKADRTAVRYIGKELDIRCDFYHTFVVSFHEGDVEDELNRGFIRLWEIRNNWENRTWVYARKNGEGWGINFEQLDDKNKVFAFEGSEVYPLGYRFNVKVSRIGEVYRLIVLDPNGLILEDSNKIIGVGKDYEYIWLASTIKSRRNNRNWSTGYIENFTKSS